VNAELRSSPHRKNCAAKLNLSPLYPYPKLSSLILKVAVLFTSSCWRTISNQKGAWIDGKAGRTLLQM